MSAILAGLVFSGVGIYYWRIGKKQSDLRMVFASMAMFIYPLFFDSDILVWLIGFALWGLAHYFYKNPTE